MTTNDRPDTTATTNVELPPWQQPTWTGPVVERRPEHADPAEWPEGAVERVVFTPAAFPAYPYPGELPYTEHFGADGWPLHTPERVKAELDPRMQTELRRWPWTTRPAEWNEACWRRSASDYDRFMRWNAQADLLHTSLAAMLPEPS